MATVRRDLVAGHPFATDQGWHGVVRPQPGGSITCARPRHHWWGSDVPRPRVLAASRSCSRRSGQATDVSVTQPVVDQGEQLAGGGDLGDVRAAALTDPGPDTTERPATDPLDRFDGGPAN